VRDGARLERPRARTAARSYSRAARDGGDAVAGAGRGHAPARQLAMTRTPAPPPPAPALCDMVCQEVAASQPRCFQATRGVLIAAAVVPRDSPILHNSRRRGEQPGALSAFLSRRRRSFSPAPGSGRRTATNQGDIRSHQTRKTLVRVCFLAAPFVAVVVAERPARGSNEQSCTALPSANICATKRTDSGVRMLLWHTPDQTTYVPRPALVSHLDLRRRSQGALVFALSACPAVPTLLCAPLGRIPRHHCATRTARLGRCVPRGLPPGSESNARTRVAEPLKGGEGFSQQHDQDS